ncbi:MAG: hypothetical protein ABI670_08085 [Chloroflexota bacterium]
MGRLEVSCRRFAILSGIEQDAGDYSVCVQPSAPALQRKGTLALITEGSGEHPSLAVEACKLAQHVVVENYFADNSLSLTSSLLTALDNANTALIQYNYSQGIDASTQANGAEVAVQGGGTRARRAKVGATAVLIRPDGAGIYLSQMAPTQAYIFHNGMVSAIPEPSAWRPSAQRPVAAMSSAQGGPDSALEDEEDISDLSDAILPSPSLGSGPGIEADLIYRRVAQGDMVILVSASLSRHLTRETAEGIVARNDADGVITALHDLAIEQGLAEAHACVLELGVVDSSGVDEDYTLPVKPQLSKQVADNGGVMAVPHGPQRPAMPALKDALRGPRDWLQRRKVDAEQQDTASPQGETEIEGSADDDALIWSQQPTQRFPQRPIDLPPYRASAQPSPEPAAESEGEETAEELDFDGWEDAPPALENPRYDSSHKIVFKPKVHNIEDDEADGAAYTDTPAESWPETESHQPYAVPAFLGGASFEEEEPANVRPFSTRRSSPAGIKGIASNAGNWIVSTTRALLPDQVGGRKLKVGGTLGGKVLPLRLVIGAALVIAALLFTFSVVSMAGNSQKAATKNLLQEAQQMETLANQPGMLPVERTEKLQLALDKANEASAANPQSEEAKLLVAKLQAELDQAQGITRFGSVKLLFDLDAIDKSGVAGGTGAAGAGVENTLSATVPLVLNEIIVQTNDAYVLDRTANTIFRCQIAASTCTAVLSEGESAGGQKAGKPIAMTMRVGNLVALDDKLTSFVLSPDTGAWTAEPLGNASSLQTPIDISTYDGNLYMLGAKPGQISKYPSGQYGQPPADWIQTPESSDALKSPVAMAIDGVIYVALADGKILTMQGGKVDRTITPKPVAGQAAATRLFTGTDVSDLYLMRADDGTITRISKEGQTLATLKAPAGAGLDKLSGMTVDEAKGKYYMVAGRKVYEATVAAPTTGSNPTNGTKQVESASVPVDALKNEAPISGPTVRPTAEP